MYVWRIFGINLEDLFIMASSFDDALAKARLINKNYNGGQVHEVIQAKEY